MSKTPVKLSTVKPSAAKAEAAKAMLATDDDLPVRVNVEIPASARKKLKQYCLDHDKTISDVLRDFIATLPE